jgi:hypothetical protein
MSVCDRESCGQTKIQVRTSSLLGSSLQREPISIKHRPLHRGSVQPHDHISGQVTLKMLLSGYSFQNLAKILWPGVDKDLRRLDLRSTEPEARRLGVTMALLYTTICRIFIGRELPLSCRQFVATQICSSCTSGFVFQVFLKFQLREKRGTGLALSAVSDESDYNHQTSLQAHATAPQGWSRI